MIPYVNYNTKISISVIKSVFAKLTSLIIESKGGSYRSGAPKQILAISAKFRQLGWHPKPTYEFLQLVLEKGPLIEELVRLLGLSVCS